MNEKLKELLFESGLGYMSGAPPAMVEKFALSLIQECANFIDSAICDDVAINGRCLKEHFGVEE